MATEDPEILLNDVETLSEELAVYGQTREEMIRYFASPIQDSRTANAIEGALLFAATAVREAIRRLARTEGRAVDPGEGGRAEENCEPCGHSSP